MICATPERWAIARRIALLTAALLALCGPARAENFPALTGRVVDAAGILDPATVATLDGKLAALETQSQRQVVVATVPDLGGEEIEDYANHLFRAWKIGDKQRNDGVLLVVAPSARKVRIEVGYGLEGIVTDALSSVIIRRAMTPRFKAGDYGGGITAAVDELSAQLRLPEDQARAVAAQAKAQLAREQRPHFDPGSVIFLLFVVGFFVMSALNRLTGGRRRYGGGVWIVPGGGFGGGWGGGGGGGFSGGGGSSGGGGASGGW